MLKSNGFISLSKMTKLRCPEANRIRAASLTILLGRFPSLSTKGQSHWPFSNRNYTEHALSSGLCTDCPSTRLLITWSPQASAPPSVSSLNATSAERSVQKALGRESFPLSPLMLYRCSMYPFYFTLTTHGNDHIHLFTNPRLISSL